MRARLKSWAMRRMIDLAYLKLLARIAIVSLGQRWGLGRNRRQWAIVLGIDALSFILSFGVRRWWGYRWPGDILIAFAIVYGACVAIGLIAIGATMARQHRAAHRGGE